MRNEFFNHIKIDRRASLSFDLQLANQIKTAILDRKFLFREIMPTSVELSAQYQIPLKDVEQAYNILLKENYLIKDIDVYYANQFDLTAGFFKQIVRIYDAIIELGLTPSIEVLDKKKITIDESLSQKSSFNLGEQVFYFRRVYFGNGQPLIVYDGYLPLNRFNDIDHLLPDDAPVYRFLEDHYQEVIIASKRTISVSNLDKHLASLFKVMPNTAGYHVHAHAYNKKLECIEHSEAWSSHNYVFEFDLTIDEV